jgi:hypothetical protein
MVKYVMMPKFQVTVTHSAVPYILEVPQGRVQRIENGFDSATLWIDNTNCANYSSKLTAGDIIKIEVKDAASDTSYTTKLQGIIATAIPLLDDSHKVKVECLGAGYGLADTQCNIEYGTTSFHPTLDKISEIIADVNWGVLPRFANHIFDSAVDTGFNYTSTIEDIVGSLAYISSPYKPNDKFINDICDYLTAIKVGAAGPHWIVDVNSQFLLTTIGAHSAAVVAQGWPTYYGGSQAAATVEEGIDFLKYNFEKLRPEANYINYYGQWRRPSNATDSQKTLRPYGANWLQTFFQTTTHFTKSTVTA